MNKRASKKRSSIEENGFVAYVMDLLGPWYPLKARKLFGVWGLYIHHKIFAIIADEALYLQHNSKVSACFEGLESDNFVYEKRGKSITMPYKKVPAEMLEDPQWLRDYLNTVLGDRLR